MSLLSSGRLVADLERRLRRCDHGQLATLVQGGIYFESC